MKTATGTIPANPETGLPHGRQWVVLPLGTWTGENMEAQVGMAKWQPPVWMCSAVKGTKFDIKHCSARLTVSASASLKTSVGNGEGERGDHLCPLDRVS